MRGPSIRERYPPPWSVEPIARGFRILDSRGVELLYVYATHNKVRHRGSGFSQLTYPEAYALARAICRLADEGK